MRPSKPFSKPVSGNLFPIALSRDGAKSTEKRDGRSCRETPDWRWTTVPPQRPVPTYNSGCDDPCRIASMYGNAAARVSRQAKRIFVSVHVTTPVQRLDRWIGRGAAVRRPYGRRSDVRSGPAPRWRRAIPRSARRRTGSAAC